MKNGVIEFPRPEDCEESTVIREMEMKVFGNPHAAGGE